MRRAGRDVGRLDPVQLGVETAPSEQAPDGKPPAEVKSSPVLPEASGSSADTEMPKPVDVGQGLSDTLAVLNAKGRGKQLGVSLDVEADLPRIQGFGGEPSMTSATLGNLYESSPSTVSVYRSTNQGSSWFQMQPDPDNGSGDDCLATDESNSVYWCNLNGSASTLPLQAQVYKDGSNLPATQAPITCTTNCSWVLGSGTAGTTCVTMGSFHTLFLVSSAMTASAVSRCASE